MTATKRYIQKILPAHLIQARVHKQLFMQFAERHGFVYFGSVNQRENEHRLIRGLTLSSSHQDKYYCLGSHDGYDIAVVQRTDTLRQPGHASHKHSWIIMTFDLHSVHDLPHFYLAHSTHSQAFYRTIFTKFAYLAPIELDVTASYPKSFLSHRTTYATLSQHNAIRELLNPEFASQIESNCSGLTFEVNENSLYLYAEHQRPTGLLLARMLNQGVWLARQLDIRAQ